MNKHARHLAVTAAMSALLALCGGCSRTPKVEARQDSADEAGSALTFTPEQRTKAGIETIEARQGEAVEQVMGYGLVLSHETVAQAVAETLQAEAVARQSRIALERARRLAGTAGAISSDLEETAVRQAAVDSTSALLAGQKLSAVIGQSAPWQNTQERGEVLQSLASGKAKLVRLTFSLNDPAVLLPATFHLSRINHGAAASMWQSDIAWPAPADASVPGNSYFVLLQKTDVMEGEHLVAWTSSSESARGFIIPDSAMILYDSRSWFYLEKPAASFARVELQTQKRAAHGYIVASGIEAGDHIVVKGAGLLLARETGVAEAD